MLEKYIPDAYQKSIYTINYNKLKDNGIKCLLFDLDNTSVPFKEKEPTKKLIQLFEELKDMNFKIIILSNATKKRLLPFKKKLLVDCMANSRKPRKQSFLKVIKTVDTKKIDQLFSTAKLSEKDIEGCYTVEMKSRYYTVKVEKKK